MRSKLTFPGFANQVMSKAVVGFLLYQPKAGFFIDMAGGG